MKILLALKNTMEKNFKINIIKKPFNLVRDWEKNREFNKIFINKKHLHLIKHQEEKPTNQSIKNLLTLWKIEKKTKELINKKFLKPSKINKGKLKLKTQAQFFLVYLLMLHVNCQSLSCFIVIVGQTLGIRDTTFLDWLL